LPSICTVPVRLPTCGGGATLSSSSSLSELPETFGCGAAAVSTFVVGVVTRGGAPSRKSDATDASASGPVSSSAVENSCSAKLLLPFASASPAFSRRSAAWRKIAQQPDRWSALENLRDDGSEDALYGLCKRFGVVSQKGIEDEQEKDWCVDVLVEKGGASLEPLKRYMKTADLLAFPLRVLGRI